MCYSTVGSEVFNNTHAGEVAGRLPWRACGLIGIILRMTV